MFRVLAIILSLLLLLTACAAPVESKSSQSSEASAGVSSAASKAETSTSREETSVSESSSIPETEEDAESLFPSWYAPLSEAPDLADYLSTERQIVAAPEYNGWQVAAYLFYIGENGSPYNTIGTYEELTDHNLYRQTQGSEPEKELLLEGDFRRVRVSNQFVYLFDNENGCWRTPYPGGEPEMLYRFPEEVVCESVEVYDNDLLMIYTDGDAYYALYIPTGEVYELGPCFRSEDRKLTRFLPLTNRSYLYRVAPVEELGLEETPPNEKHYLYNGVDGKAYEVDLSALGLRVITEEDVPTLYPLDENGVFVPNAAMQEVSLEEAGLTQ